LIGGLLIGALAAAAVPFTYLLLNRLLENADAAFHGASFFALTPGLILFFPEFDQAYPIFTCALTTFWAAAVTRRRRIYAVCFGLTLSLALFWSYTLLVLGLFLGGLTGLLAISKFGRNSGFILQSALTALLVVTLSYGALWHLAGFRPVETFQTALGNQSKILLDLARSYPRTIFWDLFDFALGAGWIGVLLAGLSVYRSARAAPRGRDLQLSLLALGQFVGVAVTGLLQTETARVWLFMAPLLMIPVGLELQHWKFSQRVLAYFCLWMIFAAVHQNMTFIQIQ
jgi:hypothetical protein